MVSHAPRPLEEPCAPGGVGVRGPARGPVSVCHLTGWLGSVRGPRAPSSGVRQALSSAWGEPECHTVHAHDKAKDAVLQGRRGSQGSCGRRSAAGGDEV